MNAAWRLEGVREARADHSSGVVRVLYDPTWVDEPRIAEQLTSAGFAPAREGGSR